MSIKESFVLPRDATRNDFCAAIAAWELGMGVTGHRAEALHRYWKRLGPRVGSQQAADQFEYVRRAMETSDE